MIDRGKKNIAGVLIDAVDYATAVQRIVRAAKKRKPYLVSALAVHGTMTGVRDPEHRYRLNKFDLLVPDGQPVRWALNLLHHASLSDRVYGPELTMRLLQTAAEENMPVYFYGATQDILENLAVRLRVRFPKLRFAGLEPSTFGRLQNDEKEELVERINVSGAQLLFVGLGCPRQEVFAYELGNSLSMPVIAVGAAFPFMAGTLAQAPAWMQRSGLEWAFRLFHEPKRLWRRYLVLNPYYAYLVALQFLGRNFSPSGRPPRSEMLFG